MRNEKSYRRTEIAIGMLWILTAFGAILGAVLINPILSSQDYLTAVFPKKTIMTVGMLGWLVNDIGIVFIGLLMFPILKRKNEVSALGYLVLRVLESICMIIGVFFALLLIPLSQEFIKSGSSSLTSIQAVGLVFKQAEYWFLNILQLVFLGIGGIILTSVLFQTKLVPRIIALIGIIGYALLIPLAILGFFGVVDPAPEGSGSIVALPVAVWEIIIMPAWLFAKGFNLQTVSP